MGAILHDDRWTLALGLGLFGLILYTGHKQLQDFREHSVVSPTSKNSQDGDNAPIDSDVVINDGKLLLTLEKAIQLETLETIAKGPSYDLRIAALKIICQRAMSADTYGTLLRQVLSDSPEVRIRGLKSLRCVFQLVGSNNISKETKIQTYAAVINSLHKALRDRAIYVKDKTGEKEGITFLAKTATGWSRSAEIIIQVGIVDFLKKYDDCEGGILKRFYKKDYSSVEIDPMMADIAEAVLRYNAGKEALVKADLLNPDKEEPDLLENTVGIFITTSNGATSQTLWLDTVQLDSVADGILEATREATRLLERTGDSTDAGSEADSNDGVDEVANDGANEGSSGGSDGASGMDEPVE